MNKVFLLQVVRSKWSEARVAVGGTEVRPFDAAKIEAGVDIDTQDVSAVIAATGAPGCALIFRVQRVTKPYPD